MIQPGTKIMIAGDSWGCGEWDNETPHARPHLGIEQYFREYGCNVMNTSIGGSGNELSTNSIMLLAPWFKPHIILWIQTDPIRNIPWNHVFPETVDDLCNLQRLHLNNIYDRLNSLGQPIYCMGGCSKLDISLMSGYTNLMPIIPSIIEFFGCVSPKFWHSNSWVPNVRLSQSAIDMLLENTSDPLKILDRKWFFPDGAHPNRAAHLKLFEHLVQHVDSPNT